MGTPKAPTVNTQQQQCMTSPVNQRPLMSHGARTRESEESSPMMMSGAGAVGFEKADQRIHNEEQNGGQMA